MAEIAVIGDYDIRDRKLADATSKSSVATTDSIRMKDTDGNEVYIARDSFVDAVRSALGPILTNMTQKTAASGGVVVNDSNDVGTMNLSNLASLLGGLKPLEIVNFGANKTSFENVCKNLRYGTVVIGVYPNSAGTSYGVIGVAYGDYQAYYGVTYNSNNDVAMTKVLSRYGGTFSWKI